jgi:septum formation protein
MTGDALLFFVVTDEPLDKPGAYAIQSLGVLIVKGIEGDYCDVIGLPLSHLGEMLKKFGVHIF